MSPSTVVADPLVGQNIGGYIVEEPLGEGAVGLVYRARHPVLNRHFAIKVLRPEIAADATSATNFAREAQTLAGLKHPAIIDIIDFGPMSGGRQYMVMEFLLGRTLELELEESGRLSPERALKICDEILDGLCAAHAVDVIHRDLKPSNVFLEKVSGGREVVKLLDFGLSKLRPALLGDQLGPASDTSIAGTPEYIAPEQAIGEAASRQSDLYSFGIILFRMLTGSLPFAVDPGTPVFRQSLAIMKKHVHQRPPTLEEAAADASFPAGLSELVAALLKKKPAERPAGAEEVRKRLAQVSRGLQEPLAVARFAPKKSRSPARFLAGLVMLMVVMGAAWWWGGGTPPVVIAPSAPVVIAAAAPTPTPTPAPEPEPAPVEEVEPEPLEGLAGLTVKMKKPARAPLPPLADCAPDGDWKKRARAELDELMTRAARSNPELTLWAADREGPLSTAIEAANNAPECRAVGLQLASFKEKVTRR